MRYNIEKWTGKLDLFAFVPNLRASNNSEKLATPPGLIASLTVLITSILFFQIKYNQLVNHHGVSYQSLKIGNYYEGDDQWSFQPGTDDEKTKYDFLLAFGIYNATDFKAPTQVERLGQPQVFMYKMSTNADGGIIQEKQDLKLHVCNMGDIEIFNKINQYQSKISLFYCLDKGQLIEFKGDFQHDNRNILVFEFEKCKVERLRKTQGYNQNSTCYNDSEAKEILHNTGAYMIYTSQTIDENAWGENWIQDKAAQYFLTGNSLTQELSLLLNKKTLIVDDFSIYNMMAPDFQRQYYEVTLAPQQISFSWTKTDSWMRVMFSLCLDKETNTRKSYNLSQLICDVGGFIFCLTIICSFLINSVLKMEISMENKIMNNVFRRKLPDSTSLGYVNVNYRQYMVALASNLFCLRRPRHELWRRVAMRRVNRELDMAKFLRKQFIMEGFLKAFSTPGQRALLKRQYSLMMPGAHDGPTTTDSQSDYDFDSYNPTNIRDFIMVNRLRKNSRESQEPVDKASVLEIFKKGKQINGFDKNQVIIDGEGFNDAVKSSRVLLGQSSIQLEDFDVKSEQIVNGNPRLQLQSRATGTAVSKDAAYEDQQLKWQFNQAIEQSGTPQSSKRNSVEWKV